ncbi:YybH family protein [Amycolatopsis nigrescens]|uniref:YybH family protein n=1 Tax=Amycolatopsis nigrescens TaxID=381445 RepID=UPI00036442F9|nr:DUF4440 domain-containing protein [Amycolatopsis nigrescens]
MTIEHDDQTTGPDPAEHVHAFVAAFNAADLTAIERGYEDGAVLVPSPGHPVTGQVRSAATQHLLGFGLPIDARLRHSYVVGDLALIIVDWSIKGTTADGIEVDLDGTSSDVLRRDDDGRWRCAIDNPFGTA